MVTFMWSLPDLKAESFTTSTTCCTRIKELSLLYYLPVYNFFHLFLFDGVRIQYS